MKNYISVGITGGIGSGKSYICQIIQSMGYPVFYSDAEAQTILQSDSETISLVKSIFGEEAYQNGELVKSYIAQKIFENQYLREELNQLVHPKVRDRFYQWAQQSDSDIVFTEAAILFEAGAYKNYDYMVLVTAPHELKIERVMKRNNFTRQQVEARMNVQWPDDKKAELANFIINNDQKEPLLPQIVKIIEAIQ